MYVSKSTGIRLVDFIDMYNPETDIYSDIIDFTKSFLDSSKRVFFIDDSEIFNKFCELFALTFYNRTLNFDTTLDFKMKLDALLLYNQMKYKRIFDASLVEINPLITYHHETNHDEQNTGASAESGTNKNIDQGGEQTHDKNAFNDLKDKTSFANLKDTKSFENRQDKNYSKLTHGLENNTETKQLVSNTPQSNVDVSNLFDTHHNVYVNGVSHDLVNSKDTGDDITDSKVDYTGKEFNERTGSYESVQNGDVTQDGWKNKYNQVDGSHSKNSGFADSKIYSEISEGYDGSQVELLDKYVNVVFDVCKTIINDIEDAHLFSSILM